mgnify:FL=1
MGLEIIFDVPNSSYTLPFMLLNRSGVIRLLNRDPNLENAVKVGAAYTLYQIDNKRFRLSRIESIRDEYVINVGTHKEYLDLDRIPMSYLYGIKYLEYFR